MRTKLTKTLLIGAVLLLAGTSCTDVLTEPKSSVTEANVFSDANAYKSFLAKIYAGLAVTGQQGPAGNRDILGIDDEGFSHYTRLLWQMQELPTDEALIAWNDAGLQELNTQLWSSSNMFNTGMYSRVFFQVGLANEFLRQSTEAKLSERGQSALAPTIQGFRAEARFLRALSYWHGLDVFGNIPLVTEDFPLGATPPEQSTREAIFSFIEDELSAIRADLPGPGAGEYGRADGAAVSMLLAKLYMNAEVYVGADQYASALSEVESVINSGMYQLDDDYFAMFLADNHNSPELIFAVPQDGLNTQTWGGTTYLTHAAVGGDMSAGDYGLDFGWGGLRVTPQFVALFPGGVNTADGRAGVFFTDCLPTAGCTVEIPILTEFRNGLAAPKYQNVTSLGQPGSNPTFPDTDYPMFRLGDAYLMYAEAHLRGGGGSRAQALDYVNQLRERAYGDPSGNITDPELTLDFILDERARELYWEGHRRTDLIRYGLFTDGLWAWKGNVEGGIATEAFRALYPLPVNELLSNPNLEQNPGY